MPENLQQLVVDLKRSILLATAAAMETFRTKAGVSPNRITIHLVDVSLISDKTPTFVVGDVDVDVKL